MERLMALPKMNKLVWIGLPLLVWVLLFSRGMYRSFDIDEHQFVSPAVLLTQQGVVPYHDYPYFHMPNLVYIYAALTAWTSHKLLIARLLSVTCGWLTLLVVFSEGWRALAGASNRMRWLGAAGISGILMSSRLFTYTNAWSWNHDTSTLCALLAFVLTLRGLRQGQIAWLVLAGALAGMALGIRLSFAFLPFPLGLAIFWARSPLTGRQRCLAACLAVAAALVVLTPAWFLWFVDPDRFVFGNVGFPGWSARFYAEFGSSGMSRASKLSEFLVTFLSDPGNAFLLLLAGFGLGYAYWAQQGWRSPFATELGMLLTLLPLLLVGAWGPTPVQYQHNYLLAPFLTLAGLYVIAWQIGNGAARVVVWQRVLVTAIVVVGLVDFPRWYWPVIQLPLVETWAPMHVHRTGEWIRENCPPGTRVLTIDPIFAQEGGLDVYPDFAVGRFPMLIGHLMSPAQRERFGISWGEKLERILADRPPGAIFCHHRSIIFVPMFEKYANDHGFRKLTYATSSAPEDSFILWVR
jgi:4-amino-4-deoxy-L-arabinose transferase-like glycosyltransferase